MPATLTATLPQSPRAANRDRVALATAAVLFYLILCAGLLTTILRANHGKFLYCLDDPYIHLALSQSIAHGHYGINAGEAASPSSSILWPFLLAPFAGFSWQPYVPLLLNLLFGIAAAAFAGWAAAAWPSIENRSADRWWRLIAALGLVLIGNLPSLTFIGMEHVLQVLLAGLCAWGILACLDSREVPWWSFAAAILAPSVRYECLVLPLALGVALWGRGQKRRALLLSLSLPPLIGFGLFLHHLGLPPLPLSVLVKGNAAATHGHLLPSVIAHFNGLLRLTHLRNFWLVLVLFVALLRELAKQRIRARRYALGGAVAAVGLHLLIGQFGWFNRYEVYIVFFSALILLYLLHQQPQTRFHWFVLVLLACCSIYISGTFSTPAAAHEIYLQQFQTHRLTSQFYTGNVAVNDLGLVSYRHPAGQYVLDVVGLGSAEAAAHPAKSADWMDSVTREHHVGLVIIYNRLLPPVPSTWHDLGQLCLNSTATTVLADQCVGYFATGLQPVEPIRSEFAAFRATLPTEGILFIPPSRP